MAVLWVMCYKSRLKSKVYVSILAMAVNWLLRMSVNLESFALEGCIIWTLSSGSWKCVLEGASGIKDWIEFFYFKFSVMFYSVGLSNLFKIKCCKAFSGWQIPVYISDASPFRGVATVFLIFDSRNPSSITCIRSDKWTPAGYSIRITNSRVIRILYPLPRETACVVNSENIWKQWENNTEIQLMKTCT